MLGGSSGDTQSLSLLAAPLESKGFSVLVVPYFASEERAANKE